MSRVLVYSLILVCFCINNLAFATTYTAVLNSSSPSWPNEAPYQIYPFYIGEANTTITVNTVSNTITGQGLGRPWYVLYSSFDSGHMGSNTIFETDMLASGTTVYSGSNYNNIYPDNFSFVIANPGSSYALLISPADYRERGTVAFTLSGARPLVDISSGTQTYSAGYSDLIKQGGGKAIVEGSISGSTLISAGQVQLGSSTAECNVSGNISLGNQVWLELKNIANGTFSADITDGFGTAYVLPNQNGVNLTGSITREWTTVSFWQSATLSGALSANNLYFISDVGSDALVSGDVTGSDLIIRNMNNGQLTISGNVVGSGATIYNTDGGVFTISGDLPNNTAVSNESSLTITGNLGDVLVGPTISNSGTAAISATSMRNTTLNNSGGTMTVSCNVHGTLNQSGGTCNFAGGTNILDTATVTGGTWNATGSMNTISSDFDISGGTANLSVGSTNTFAGLVTVGGGLLNLTLNPGGNTYSDGVSVTGGVMDANNSINTIVNGFAQSGGTSYFYGSTNTFDNIAVSGGGFYSDHSTNVITGDLAVSGTGGAGVWNSTNIVEGSFSLNSSGTQSFENSSNIVLEGFSNTGGSLGANLNSDGNIMNVFVGGASASINFSNTSASVTPSTTGVVSTTLTVVSGNLPTGTAFHFFDGKAYTTSSDKALASGGSIASTTIAQTNTGAVSVTIGGTTTTTGGGLQAQRLLT